MEPGIQNTIIIDQPEVLILSRMDMAGFQLHLIVHSPGRFFIVVQPHKSYIQHSTELISQNLHSTSQL